MSRLFHRKFWLLQCSLGLLLGVGWWLHHGLGSFTGELWLTRGQVERTVVAPHESRLSFGLAQRGVSADQLLLSNGDTVGHLDQTQRFDAVLMPFGLGFEEVEILAERPDLHELDIQAPAGAETYRIESGTDVEAGGHRFTVEAIGPWEGLIAHPRGEAMAAVRWIEGETTTGTLFLDDGAWNYPTAEVAVQFQWHTDSATAEDDLASARESLAGAARWGARDGKAIQWFQGITPGNGLQLRDGTRLTLLKSMDPEASLRVRLEDQSGVRAIDVPANATDGAGPIFYQNPAQCEHVFLIHAWEDGVARIQHIEGNGPASEVQLAAGERWPVGPDGGLQLDQVLSRALPVTQSAGQLFAARLVGVEGAEYLPEGQVKTIQGIRMAYRRVRQAPEARLQLVPHYDDERTGSTILLRTGERRNIGTWVVSASEKALGPDGGIALTVTRNPDGFGHPLGLLLIAGGSGGLLLARFHGRGLRSHSRS